MTPPSDSLRVGRRSVTLSKPDKVLFPDDGYTKSDLIGYYRGVAPAMVAETKARPATLERFPDGIEAERVFSKSIPKHFPDWIGRAKLRKKGGHVTHVVCNDAATLVYLANQAALTLHVALSRVDRIDVPDQVIFDLDPSGSDFAIVRRTALRVKELLEELDLVPFVKTSGSKGLHVVAPLRRSATFDEVRPFARDVAHVLAARHPRDVTVEQRKDRRNGKIFLDWLRNAYAQTAVAPYSVRARPGAPVAMPLEWEEVHDKDLTPASYTIENAGERARERPWEGWRRHARSFGGARRALDALIAEAE